MKGSAQTGPSFPPQEMFVEGRTLKIMLSWGNRGPELALGPSLLLCSPGQALSPLWASLGLSFPTCKRQW